MIAVTFPQANDVLKKPGKMTDEQVAELPVWKGTIPIDDKKTMAPGCISVWMPNKEDIEAVNSGQPIYMISIMSTVTEPVTDNGGNYILQPNGKIKTITRTFGGINSLTTENPFK